MAQPFGLIDGEHIGGPTLRIDSIHFCGAGQREAPSLA
jgi:hypothetical protein